MRGIGEAFQRSRKEKEQVENVKLLLNHSLPTSNQNIFHLTSDL
ncbi:MAG: hypothetical protein AAF573_13485 [Bacteroidota bacterium]